jgi:hypothetical protein
MYVAGGLIQGFALGRSEAKGLLEEWNRKCSPPWGDHELEHKLDDAEDEPSLLGVGYKLRDPKYDREVRKSNTAPHKNAAVNPPRSQPTWSPAEHRLLEVADHGAELLGSLGDSNVESIRGSSPMELGDDFASYLKVCWNPDEIVWMGHVTDTGDPIKAAFFRTAGDWAKRGIQGDRMLWTSGCRFVTGCHSRCKDPRFMLEHRYIIVESDRIPYSRQAAIFWFLKKQLKLRIPMVVDTMGRSLHRCVDTRGLSPEFLAKFQILMCGIHAGMEEVGGKNRRRFRGGMGCDPATFRGSQPARLPGAIRPAEPEKLKRGGKQQIIWLDNN